MPRFYNTGKQVLLRMPDSQANVHIADAATENFAVAIVTALNEKDRNEFAKDSV